MGRISTLVCFVGRETNGRSVTSSTVRFAVEKSTGRLLTTDRCVLVGSCKASTLVSVVRSITYSTVRFGFEKSTGRLVSNDPSMVHFWGDRDTLSDGPAMIYGLLEDGARA